MNRYCYIGVALACLLAGCSVAPEKATDYAAPYFAGVSNGGRTGGKPYLTAGDRAYIVGLQNGSFPDMGGHVPGEMGGVWTPPVKLADGFWLKLADVKNNREAWLLEADSFINYPTGNRFVYKPVLDGIEASRFQYVPEGKNGVVIRYMFTNTSDKPRQVSVDFVLKSDISPVWFSNENGIYDGNDSVAWNETLHVFEGKDLANAWYAVWGSDRDATSYTVNGYCPVETRGAGVASTVTSLLQLEPGRSEQVTYFVCGSSRSRDDALAAFAGLAAHNDSLLAAKERVYRSVLSRARIEIPDKQLEEAYNWVKINTQWLVMELPGIGRFLTAGAVEYPWLFGCDNSYAQQGVAASGDFGLAQSTLRTLGKVSEEVNGNGRIIHEMSSNGFVGNKGNTQETAHFIVAAWNTFRWTGNTVFLKDVYPAVVSGIRWLTREMDANRNGFPEGYGIMEVRGLNAELIDVAVYTQQALEAAAGMASLLGDASASGYREQAAALKEKINTAYWDETESSYCDFYGTREQALATVRGAIEQLGMDKPYASTEEGREKIAFYTALLDRIKDLPAGMQRGWFTNKNWVVTTPMETGIAPVEKALRNLDKIRTENCGLYGPYLSAVEKKHRMTIATGVQAMSEARYGRTDRALEYMKMIAATLHATLPGSINEMMPDYGCPVQAWTVYGVVTPLITHIFGVTPDAYRRQAVFAPHWPSGWERMALYDLPVGDNSFSFEFTKGGGKAVYRIVPEKPGWECSLRLPGIAGKTYRLNGKEMIAGGDTIPLVPGVNTVVIPCE
ncbi:MAG: amylo-alpha-1,6-glucosidase [Parabacteroides sp.]|nr:amylo-alpha-1,6-glucosidase [Parabacteroides sp.]